MTLPRRSAIVTIRRKPGRFGAASDMTPEEIQRRGDAPDALWRDWCAGRGRDDGAQVQP